MYVLCVQRINMDNTCTEDCSGYKKRKNCPNHLFTWWKDEKTGEIKNIEDCAPKRTLSLVQDLYNRFIGLQKSCEEERNAQKEMSMALVSAVGLANKQPGKVMIDLKGNDE